MTLLSNARFAFSLDLQKEGDGIEGGEIHARARLLRAPEQVCGHHPPTTPGTVFRLISVHLNSLGNTLRYRAQQMEILANVLRESGCSGGIIAGDFNAISPGDDELVDKNELLDA